MEKKVLKIANQLCNPSGRYSDKFARAGKLINRFDELDSKFRGITERGITKNTEHARCALACLLMLHTGIRVGNEGSAEGYMTKPHPYSTKEPEFVQTYGLTTMLVEHVTIRSGKIKLFFVGKKQVDNYFEVKDKNISWWMTQLIHKSKDNNSTSLFNITDYQLTKFIKKYVGRQFSPKDLRCMTANIIAAKYLLNEANEVASKKDLKAELKSIFEHVSEKLNNTPGVCKKSYVSPKLPDLAEGLLLTK